MRRLHQDIPIMHRQMSRKGEERYLLVHRHISGGGSCYQLAQHCSCGAIKFVILLYDKQGLWILVQMLQYRVFQVPVLLCTLSIDVIHALQHLHWKVNYLRPQQKDTNRHHRSDLELTL